MPSAPSATSPHISIVSPKDLVAREEDTALRRMLPMAHQKICRLPTRIDTICTALNTYSHQEGPDAGLASSMRRLCDCMKNIYRYLCSSRTAPEDLLPFSGPDFAEALGVLALKLERWVRDFEALPGNTSRKSADEASRRAGNLVEYCEQMREVLWSVKNDRCLERKIKRSTDGISSSRYGYHSNHSSTSSSQPGLGRSIFGV